MSITDELRDWGLDAHASWKIDKTDVDALHAIADRIDAEYERMYADLTIGMEPMTEESMAEHGWVKLPVDADGVPIRVGDELTSDEYKGELFTCGGISLEDGFWTVRFRFDEYSGTSEWTQARRCHHIQPDSWQRIIEDAYHYGIAHPHGYVGGDIIELVERCKRLAGEDA